MNTNNAVIGTGLTTISTAAWLDDLNRVLVLVCSLLTIIYWLRLWLRNPTKRPPWHRGRWLAVLPLVLLLQGCARLHIVQTESPTPEGNARIETRTTISTLFNGQSELARLRATITEKSQSQTVSGYAAQVSDTNAVRLVESVASGIAQGMLKSIRP